MDRATGRCARLLGGLLCTLLLGCNQSDDVVAHVSAALGGTGAGAGQGGDPGVSGAAAGSPPPAIADAGITPECESQIPGFDRLAIIAETEDCFVPLMDSTRAVLTLFFMAQPESLLPGESVPFSVCALPFPPPFYEGADNQFYLCPAECQRLRDRVAEEQAMIRACLEAMI